MKNFFKVILYAALAIYFAIACYMYAAERSFIYSPSKRGVKNPSFYQTPYEEVYFRSRDGVKLQGWWLPQENHNESTISLLYCHGNGANLSSLAHVSAIFYYYGFDTLLFEYRSFGGSDKAPLTEKGIVSDAQGALHWLKDRRQNQKVIVWGHSLGGSVAAHLANKERVDGLILENPVPSIADMAAYRYPYLPVIDNLLLDKFNTKKYVQKRFGTPLLELQAEQDLVIPPHLAIQVYDLAAKPKQILWIKDAGHNDFPEVEQDYRVSIFSWIKRAVLGDASSSNDSTSRNASIDRNVSRDR